MAKDFGPKYDADMPAEHKTAETKDRCPVDRKLRGFKFAIHSRPKAGPTLWERNGRVVTQELALQLVEREIKTVEAAKVN